MDQRERKYILDVPFDVCTFSQALDLCTRLIETGKQHIAVTPNPEMLVEARENKPFLEVLRESHVSIADGVGILWASRFIHMANRPFFHGKKRFFTLPLLLCDTLLKNAFMPAMLPRCLPERVTGVDMCQCLCERASKKHWKVFLLGAAPGVAEGTKKILEKRYPGLEVAGIFAGSPREEEETYICQRIHASQPDILFVAYGAPKQELWIQRNLPRMPSVKLAMGIGGAFDFVVGKQKRAPAFFRKTGFEWLFRLVLQPRRVHRIYNATFRFISIVFSDRWRKNA